MGMKLAGILIVVVSLAVHFKTLKSAHALEPLPHGAQDLWNIRQRSEAQNADLEDSYRGVADEEESVSEESRDYDEDEDRSSVTDMERATPSDTFVVSDDVPSLLNAAPGHERQAALPEKNHVRPLFPRPDTTLPKLLTGHGRDRTSDNIRRYLKLQAAKPVVRPQQARTYIVAPPRIIIPNRPAAAPAAVPGAYPAAVPAPVQLAVPVPISFQEISYGRPSSPHNQPKMTVRTRLGKLLQTKSGGAVAGHPPQPKSTLQRSGSHEASAFTYPIHKDKHPVLVQRVGA